MKHIFFIIIIIIILIVSSFTGCMMTGGMMHKMDDDGHKEMSENLIKEIEINNYKITAEFPPLFNMKEVTFRIKIYSLKDSMASTASVRLLISRGVEPSTEIGHEHHSDAVQFDKVLDKDSSGNYSDTYLVKATKNLKISYVISELEDVVLKKPIEIEAERSVHNPQKQNGMWMHDIGPYAIIGGVVMFTMMVFMVGRVF